MLVENLKFRFHRRQTKGHSSAQSRVPGKGKKVLMSSITQSIQLKTKSTGYLCSTIFPEILCSKIHVAVHYIIHHLTGTAENTVSKVYGAP